MDEKPLQNTIEDLQNRLLFQEDAIDHLNRSVAQQAQQIDALQQQLRFVYAQLKQLAEKQPDAGHDELPPHY